MRAFAEALDSIPMALAQVRFLLLKTFPFTTVLTHHDSDTSWKIIDPAFASFQNCGLQPVQTLAEVKARQRKEKNNFVGVDCNEMGVRGT